MATKRLRELLEARKYLPRDNSAYSNGHLQQGKANEKSLHKWLDQDLEVKVHVHKVRTQFDKQKEVQAALEKELALLKQVDQFSDVKVARIASIENMIGMTSVALKSMVSQLTEAEERECTLNNHGCWNQLRSMRDAKNVLQYLLNATAETRCQLWEKQMELKDLKEQLSELITLLQQSEAQRKELVTEQKTSEQAAIMALNTPTEVENSRSLKHLADEMSVPLSPMSLPAPKQLKFSPGVVNGSARESLTFLDEAQKMIHFGELSTKRLEAIGQAGKLWRWKRSHHQWLLQFKWKWQKPWKLPEWIKHSDETIMRSRPRPQEYI